MTFRLCYISSNWAYFTSQDVKKQWGDDWNDAPYEHNAGTPYEPCWHNFPAQRKGKPPCNCDACQKDWNPDGTPKWEILKVGFDGSLYTPGSVSGNSCYSVQDINAGKVPWLASESGESVVYAGATLAEFREKVTAAGGCVYAQIPEITKREICEAVLDTTDRLIKTVGALKALVETLTVFTVKEKA